MYLSMESQAPAIKAQNWIGGEPLANFQPGTVYVLEFFSTTCPHCVAPMLNLIQLQEKYRDRGLEVVGVAAEERAATADDARARTQAGGRTASSKPVLARGCAADPRHLQGREGLSRSSLCGSEGECSEWCHTAGGEEEPGLRMALDVSFQDVEGVDTPSLRRCGKVLPLIIT